MHRLTEAAILTMALVVLVAPAGGQTQAGSITGHVKLTTRGRGTPVASPIYPTRNVGRQAAPTPEIKNVVVYLKGVTFRGELPVMHRELKQQDETFVPHV